MDLRLSDQHYFFVYDPILFGYSTVYWKDITGAGTISSNKVRVNASTIASKEQYLRGDFTFNMIVPAAPTTGDNRKFGLVSPAQGITKNAIFFKVAGAVFTAEFVNAAGTATSLPITWLAAWTNTAANYRISWLQRSVAFYINDIKVAEQELGDDPQVLPDRQALSAYILNANSDNMDLAYLLVNAAEHQVAPKDNATSVVLGTGDIEIGAVEIKNGTDDTRLGVFAEDAAHTSGDNGLLPLAVRNDGGTVLAGTTGDYIPFSTDATGALRVTGVGATAAAVPAIAGYDGAQARTSEDSAATNANLRGLVADAVGKLIVLPYANPENFVSGLTAAMTGTTSTSLIAAPAGSLRNYVTHLIVTNSHATVGTFVIIQDGSGGTTIYEGYAAPAGGGFSISFPTPLRQPTVATALYCADVTTGANVIVSASGYKGL